MKRKIVLSFILIVICQKLFAHPHSWVQLTTDFLINLSGELTEIRQRWVFDPFYSALTIDDLKKTYESLDAGFTAYGADIVNNLDFYQYYSHISVDDKKIPVNRPFKSHLSTIAMGDQTLLILEMHFKVEAEALQSAHLTWQVYDPTYYVSMRHDSFEQVRIYNQSLLECEPSINEPDPGEETLEYATSLDSTQKNSQGLGILFAQTISVKCY